MPQKSVITLQCHTKNRRQLIAPRKVFWFFFSPNELLQQKCRYEGIARDISLILSAFTVALFSFLWNIEMTIFTKACSPGFRLGSNPDLAGDSKPAGASVKAWSGAWPRQWAICWWLAGGQLLKAGRKRRGRGGCVVLTLPLSLTWAFECQFIGCVC